jgi:hypothetical protein
LLLKEGNKVLSLAKGVDLDKLGNVRYNETNALVFWIISKTGAGGGPLYLNDNIGTINDHRRFIRF